MEYLDIDLARQVMEQITVGGTVDLFMDNTECNRKVIGKTAYSVTVQGKTSNLTVAVSDTKLYRKGYEGMVRTALPGKRGPGRPPRVTQSQAPVEAPQSTSPNTGWPQPPGPEIAGWPDVAVRQPTEAERMAATPIATEYKPGEPPRAMFHPSQIAPVENAGDTDWQNKLKEILVPFTRELVAVVKQIENELTAAREENDAREPEQTTKTCGQCIHIDVAGNKCGKFNMLPPLEVIFAAEEKCPDFMAGESEAPPF